MLEKLKIIVLGSFCAVLTGCAANITPDHYTEANVGDAMVTKRGVILDARNVTVGSSSKMGNNAMGLIGGGVAGGVIGNQLGGGRGNALTTLAGAGLGALGGAALEQQLNKQQGVEYTVEIDGTGELVTVTQGLPAYAAGTAVKVLLPTRKDGRARVIPFNK